MDLYDFGTSDKPLLFKPTLSETIRVDRAGARSYFVGGSRDYPGDHGFLKRGWKEVVFCSAIGPTPLAGGLNFMDMGQYIFIDENKAATRADYTFVYHKLDSRVLICLHHSSLTWTQPIEG